MKKITVEKSEGIAEVIDAILETEDSDVLLAIPKESALARSGSNFRLLKREADSADKTIVIESTDDIVLAFAKEAGIARGQSLSRHPASGAGVSDIVARSGSDDTDDEQEEEEKKARRNKKTPPVKLTVRGGDDEDSGDEEDPDDREKAEEEQGERSFFGENRFFQKRSVPDDDDDEESGGAGKTIAWIIGIIVVLAVAFYAVTVVFGHAQVTIDFTQTPWTYQNNFVASESATAPTAGATVTTIPAQVFTSQKNVTQLFPATGPSVGGGTKAQGTITVYNDYSSAPQELVATTRFLTPNGQIFRLVNDITVPGATVSANGTITPSSITAPIIADQAGPAYNVGPVPKLTIPGFQSNSGKYAGFYGAITGQTTGGTTGSHPTASAADIAGAKASTTAILESDLQDGFSESYPNNFKILDGATDIAIAKLIVSTSTDANGDFTVFGEASMTAIGFDESALTQYLLGLASSGQPSSTFKTINLSYSDVQANFATGQVSFSLSAQGATEPAFSPADFASSIAGQSIGNARAAIEGLPELSDGKISVWPVWLWNMPSDPNKIQVTAN